MNDESSFIYGEAMVNLSRCVRHHALRRPDRTAIVYAGSRVSYGALWRRIMLLSRELIGRGVRKGDRVALLMKNSSAFIEIALAVSHVGAVLVPINFRLVADEVDYILHDSGAVLLFCDEELATWKAAAPAIVIVDENAQADATRLIRGEVFPLSTMTSVGLEDLMRIMYTSGTTDRPKGVMHVYRNFYAKTADQIVELELAPTTRLLVTGPLYHVGAFDLPGIGVLWVGGLLCIQREFDPGAALDLIAQERLDASWLAPVMTGAMMAEQAIRARDVSSLRWTIGGGERTPEARIKQYAEAFPNARYIDAYGLTETGGGDTFMEAGREIEKIGSVGRPISQVDIEIRDEAGRPLPVGQEGEVCICGPKVTSGYWNAPEKTAASFFGDWLRTGDVGFLDDEGFLFLTDRKKDMIISGGENIASSEVERAILEMPQVQDVAVIGAPHERWGERPVAFAVVRQGMKLAEAEVLTHCRTRLAGFKVPDRIYFAAELPRTASGKVLKRELRTMIMGGYPERA